MEQPHIEQERARAAAENRMPVLGPAAFRSLPLTGAFQSTFPSYRQRSSFARLGGAPQAAYPAGQLDTAAPRSNAELFTVGEGGVVEAVHKPDGSAATAVDKEADAQAWAAAFSHDFFCNQCTNHEHNCTVTCVKYVKKKLEAKTSLRSNRTPACRRWFFRILE